MLITATEFEFSVSVALNGVISVCLSKQTKTGPWLQNFVMPGYDMEELIGIVWDEGMLLAVEKKAVSDAIRQKVNEWTQKQYNLPIHVRRDLADFAENQRRGMDGTAVAEYVLVLFAWAVVIFVLVWIASKTDVGQSWGW